MTVYVQSECCGRVTKIGLHGFYIITILKTQDRVSVTQTVNIGLFRSDLLCNFLAIFFINDNVFNIDTIFNFNTMAF